MVLSHLEELFYRLVHFAMFVSAVTGAVTGAVTACCLFLGSDMNILPPLFETMGS